MNTCKVCGLPAKFSRSMSPREAVHDATIKEVIQASFRAKVPVWHRAVIYVKGVKFQDGTKD